MVTILAAILVFGILVTVHELGHFICAKLTGMQVDEFAIGFGPVICQHKSGDTVYSLRCVPLGGFNKIAGMDPEDEPCANGFNTKAIWQRMLVIVAGAGMNIILPIIVFFGVFTMYGIEQMVNEPLIGGVTVRLPASQAGIQPGDRIITIDGEKVVKWTDMQRIIASKKENVLDIVLEREGVQHSYKLTPIYNPKLDRSIVGIVPKVERVPLSVPQAFTTAFRYTYNLTISMVRGLYRIVRGREKAQLAGPIGVAQMAGEAAQHGVLELLGFTVFLSINLAVINLLPIPALDGGHLIVLLVEGVRGKPLSPKNMERIQYVGLAIIIAIFIFSTMQDIERVAG